MELIDTHAHITCDDLYPNIDEIIENVSEDELQRYRRSVHHL